MGKHKRRRQEVSSIEEAIQEHGPLPQSQPAAAPPSNPTPYRRERQSLPLSLDDIRASALRERANVSHTIADLEAWRAEIDATIAFLRSRER